MQAIKDQSPCPEVEEGKSSKLRYPLRSSNLKSKEAVSSASASSKRGRPASNVSQSVNMLDLSGKEKSAKPARRFSVAAKSAIGPLPRSTGAITPISETRMKKLANDTGKTKTPDTGKIRTPASDISKSGNQRKFCVLSSASYWLSQIKVSESATKHLISLGFFKLALEAGCEPLQRMRDELKSYARRHNLLEHRETAEELLRRYNIIDDLEELQVSVTCSQAPLEGVQSSDEEIQNSSAAADARKLKPKSLNSERLQGSVSAKRDSSQKKLPVSKNRVSSANNNTGNLKSGSNVGSVNIQKKSIRSSGKQEVNKEKKNPMNGGKKSATEKDMAPVSPDKNLEQDDKENMESEQPVENSLAEVV